jgi:hypothetical protein
MGELKERSFWENIRDFLKIHSNTDALVVDKAV